MTQEHYIKELLERFNMDDANPLSTPLAPGSELSDIVPSHIFVLQDCILVSQSQAECLKTNVYHADFLVVSELQNELISYYTLSVYHLQLDNICEDCYNLYKEADVHQFCR